MSSDSPNETFSLLDNQESPLYTAKFDYQAQGGEIILKVFSIVLPYFECVFLLLGEDELDLRVGQIVWVLSKDESISGDYGWWTGKIGEKVGIFPANYVTNDDLMLRNGQPDEIQYDQLDVKEVIGAGKKSFVLKSCNEPIFRFLTRWVRRSKTSVSRQPASRC